MAGIQRSNGGQSCNNIHTGETPTLVESPNRKGSTKGIMPHFILQGIIS